MTDILVLGDVHAQPRDITRQLELSRHMGYDPKSIIQLGDIGIWKDVIKEFPRLNIPLYYVLGNHEDFHAETMIQGLPDCYKLLHPYKPTDICGLETIGISRSNFIDSFNTPPGSTIRYKEVETLLKKHPKIDMVASHDCPSDIGMRSNFFGPWDDAGSEILEEVLLELKPELWLFGHHHIDYTVYTKGCHLCGFKVANDGFGILDSNRKSTRFISSLTEK